MRQVILYIAMSLDGFIADRTGGVGWLEGDGSSAGAEDSYRRFIRRVDTVVMGWNTYHQVTTQLSPGEWVYRDQCTYVITHRKAFSTEPVIFTQEDPCQLVERLKGEPGTGIWICGGGSIVRPLVRADLIDEYVISVIPTLLGAGIRLFGEDGDARPLKLIRAQTDQGIAELSYLRRQ